MFLSRLFSLRKLLSQIKVRLLDQTKKEKQKKNSKLNDQNSTKEKQSTCI